MATDLLPLTDGGVLVLRPDTDLEDLFSIIDAERHWRCAVFGDALIWCRRRTRGRPAWRRSWGCS